MSGHSKWANIKRQKAVVDAKRGVKYAKLSIEIITATKIGGSDPNQNLRLRHAIDKAKTEGFPNENIQRAIDKGSGKLAGNNFESLTYEGYGAGGAAIMVKCETDNRNRTAGDIRSYFSKYGGNLGESNCVSWMFNHFNMIEISPKDNNSFDIDSILELNIDDYEESEHNRLLIYCQNDVSSSVIKELDSLFKVISTQEIYKPTITREIDNFEDAKKIVKLIEILESHDDVTSVISNFEIRDEWLDELA